MKGFKDVIILVLITTIAGFCLSLVYTVTQAKIEASKQAEISEALKNVAPFMTDSPEVHTFDYDNARAVKTPVTIYDVVKNGNHLGAALKLTTPEGYAGDITFLMGVNAGGAITGFEILETRETPGLGAKASDKDIFWGQFVGKTLDSMDFRVKKDGGDVDAITASTITSRAITHALEEGLKIYNAYRGGA